GEMQEVQNNEDKSHLLHETFFPKPTARNRSHSRCVYPPSKFPLEQILESQIYHAIHKLKPYKASDPSGISNAVLKHCTTDLVPHLLHIYRATFQLKMYPSQWCITSTLALRKVGK
ncbi:hypothetical protein K439DRAFT_1246851, partial [Ramaria rubella]